jgi:hypothetical protein
MRNSKLDSSSKYDSNRLDSCNSVDDLRRSFERKSEHRMSQVFEERMLKEAMSS